MTDMILKGFGCPKQLLVNKFLTHEFLSHLTETSELQNCGGDFKLHLLKLFLSAFADKLIDLIMKMLIRFYLHPLSARSH